MVIKLPHVVTIDDFVKLDIRVGKIVDVEDFPEARKPFYKITIDFGEGIGPKQSAVGATHNYTKDELKGKLMLGVVNLPPRQIGPFTSEVLSLGVTDEQGHCVLIEPDRKVFLGAKLF